MQKTIEAQRDENLCATPFWAEFVEPIGRDRHAEALAMRTYNCEYDPFNDGDYIVVD